MIALMVALLVALALIMIGVGIVCWVQSVLINELKKTQADVKQIHLDVHDLLDRDP